MSQRKRAPCDPQGMFKGVVAFLRPHSVQPRRLQVWKQRLVQMGGVIEERLSEKVTHILAIDGEALLQQISLRELRKFHGKLVSFQWLEDCLKSGERLPEDPFLINFDGEKESKNKTTILNKPRGAEVDLDASQNAERRKMSENVEPSSKDDRSSDPAGSSSPTHHTDTKKRLAVEKDLDQRTRSCHDSEDNKRLSGSPQDLDHVEDLVDQNSTYQPPDLNRNITEVFGKLINIYRALGDDRRSFSYYKAIPVIEKLPYKIVSAEQVKDLPTIGKSLQDHINEIVTTGKLSKLEHFENDEKVRTISLFGEVWGIGPATAHKLYEKGYRKLDDLQNDDSLTHAQRVGLKYFDDIQQRIPRHEVEEMEALIKKVGQSILPGVVVVCGGSYRRGKASCGDMDIVITHPDGASHIGFLPRLVQSLKDINFLKEDLVFSVHSIEGSDAGVDTYFGLCSYPGRELRHRIDFKVYPKNRYAFGLIAWTGNDVLNRRLRLLAESKGYRLDDTGLYLATQGSSGKRAVSSNVIVNCDTEKDVFDVLGFPWLEPHERNL